MKILILIPLLLACSGSWLVAQKNSFPYLDPQGVECILTWNSETGISKLYYYEPSEEKFIESPYQLPEQAIEEEGSYQFYPYLDADSVECVLTWNTKTGISKLYYYEPSEALFLESPYQLPEKPTGEKGPYQFRPYLDQNNEECILTWNSETGISKLYYFDPYEGIFLESPYQLPVMD